MSSKLSEKPCLKHINRVIEDVSLLTPCLHMYLRVFIPRKEHMHMIHTNCGNRKKYTTHDFIAANILIRLAWYRSQKSRGWFIPFGAWTFLCTRLWKQKRLRQQMLCGAVEVSGSLESKVKGSHTLYLLNASPLLCLWARWWELELAGGVGSVCRLQWDKISCLCPRQRCSFLRVPAGLQPQGWAQLSLVQNYREGVEDSNHSRAWPGRTWDWWLALSRLSWET